MSDLPCLITWIRDYYESRLNSAGKCCDSSCTRHILLNYTKRGKESPRRCNAKCSRCWDPGGYCTANQAQPEKMEEKKRKGEENEGEISRCQIIRECKMSPVQGTPKNHLCQSYIHFHFSKRYHINALLYPCLFDGSITRPA